MNKKVIIPALVLGAATAVGALSYVSATSAAGNGYRGEEIVSNLAEKLGVEESQIELAMNEMREERRVQTREKREEKLQEAVDDGVITQEQKKVLVNHLSEMRKKREQLKEGDKSWCEENGIDREALREYTGGMGHGGSGGSYKMGI